MANRAAHLQAYQFKPGQSGNPNGRQKGSRNKLGEAFLLALYEDFQQHGAEAVVACRETKPDAYVRVIASLLPQEVKVSTNPLAEMSDDELSRLIDIIRSADSAVVSPRGGKAEKGSAPIAH